MTRVKPIRDRHGRGALLLGALALAWLLLASFYPPITDRLTGLLHDPLLRLHAAGQSPSGEVVLIDIDEESVQRLTSDFGRWPWPRAAYAMLLEALGPTQPRAVVFDLVFSEEDVRHRAADAWFGEAVADTAGVYLASLELEAASTEDGIRLADVASAFGVDANAGDPKARGDLLLPWAVPPAHWRLGLINFHQEADEIGRSYWLRKPVNGWDLPSLPARVAEDIGATVPDQALMRLNWRGDEQQPFPSVSFEALYREYLEPGRPIPPGLFQDKVVVVGVTAFGIVHDRRPTAMSSTYFGTAILATALDNLMAGDWLRSMPRAVSLGLGLALLAAAFVAMWRRWGASRLVATGAAISLLAVGLSYGALHLDVYLPVGAPLTATWLLLIAGGLRNYRLTQQEKLLTETVFGRFLDPRVVEQLVGRGYSTDDLAGEAREVTVLFSDIRGFTTLSETRGPEEIVSLLNQYFSRQVEIIFKHGGTLDKFIGDAIMAFWGAPNDDPAQARHAVDAALDMLDALAQFKNDMGELGDTFDIGIGIHTGPAVVGFIGSDRRQDYTAIGDTVNLASRIEGLTKDRARILISQATMDACGDAFDFTSHGEVMVKGRTQAVHIHEPRRRP